MNKHSSDAVPVAYRAKTTLGDAVHSAPALGHAPSPPRSFEATVLRRIAAFALAASFIMASAGSSAGVLHDAAKSGDLERVQELVVDGVDVNEGNVKGETPLIVASLEGQGEVANYLLQRGAELDATSSSGLSALHAAAYGGHADIARLLIAKGAEVNGAENRFKVTPLHLAAEENHAAVAKLLIDNGAEVDVVERNGYTPLSRAGWREHWEIVELLLANGAVCQDAAKVGKWLYEQCDIRTDAN